MLWGGVPGGLAVRLGFCDPGSLSLSWGTEIQQPQYVQIRKKKMATVMRRRNKICKMN